MSYRYKSAFRNSIIFVVISLAACFSHPVLGEENPCALLPKAVQLVEQIRGLRFLHPVKCRAVHQEEYTKRSIDYFFTLISQKELEYQERLYQAVGLLPETYRYSRCYLEESSRYTEAFYDIFRHEIVLPAWKRSELNLLVHEAVHALQDQHFRLAKHAQKAVATTDHSLAYSALVEGDAIQVQNLSLKLTPNSYHKPPEESLKTQSQELKISDTTKGQRDCTFPPSLENLVYFPYEFGQVFADRLMLETKSFRAINAAFRSPPETSSEIMHSGFFGTFQRQEVSIPLKKLQLVFEFSSTPHHIYSDSLGQYAISLILRESMEKTTAILAAKGWRGDRVTLYDVGGGEFIAWRSIWENEKEAKEFLRALLLSLEFRFRMKLLRESSQALMVLTGNQRILIDRTNNTVDMAILRPKT